MTDHRGVRLHLRARTVPAVMVALLAVVPSLSWAGAHLSRSVAAGTAVDAMAVLLAPALAAAIAVRVLQVPDAALEASAARSGRGWRRLEMLALLVIAPLLVALTAAPTGQAGGLVVRDTAGCTALAVLAVRVGLGPLAGLPGTAYVMVVPFITAPSLRPNRATQALAWPAQPGTDLLSIVIVLALAGTAILTATSQERRPSAS